MKTESFQARFSSFFYSICPITFFLPIPYTNFFLFSCLFISILILFQSRNKLEYKSLFSLLIPFGIILYGFGLDIANRSIFNGFKSLEVFLPLLIFPIIISILDVKEENVGQAKVSFLASCFIAAIYCIIVALYKNEVEHNRMVMDNWNFEETLKFYEAYPIGNINWGFFLYEELSKPIGFLPVYLSIYFCIALLIAFEDLKSSKNYKALYGLVIVILTAELFLLSAKGPLLILLVIAGFYLFRFFRNRVSFFSSLVIVSIIFCSVYFVPAISFRIKSMISEIGDQSYLKETETGNWHRLHLWKTSLNLVEKKMFFGYGLFGSEKVLAAELNKKGKAYFNSHNQYLMFLMATGVFGLAFIVFSIYCQLRVSILKKDAFYLCFLITIALILITENFLSRHKGLILYSFFNSIYFFSLKKK